MHRTTEKMEQIDDASTELMMGSGDRVMLHLGTAFLECSKEEATEHCEKEVDKIQGLVDVLVKEEGAYRSRSIGLA